MCSPAENADLLEGLGHEHVTRVHELLHSLRDQTIYRLVIIFDHKGFRNRPPYI